VLWLVVTRRLDLLGLHGHPSAHHVIVGLEIVQIRVTQMAEILRAKSPEVGFHLYTRDGHDNQGNQREQNHLANVLLPQSRVPPSLHSKIHRVGHGKDAGGDSSEDPVLQSLNFGPLLYSQDVWVLVYQVCYEDLSLLSGALVINFLLRVQWSRILHHLLIFNLLGDIGVRTRACLMVQVPGGQWVQLLLVLLV
jgi:hypothetical protein